MSKPGPKRLSNVFSVTQEASLSQCSNPNLTQNYEFQVLRTLKTFSRVFWGGEGGRETILDVHFQTFEVFLKQCEAKFTSHNSKAWNQPNWPLLLLGLLLSRFSRVWLYATPWTAAHQAPPSLRFSRREHWSGLPFPSPMHESEKWKWSRSVVSNS